MNKRAGWPLIFLLTIVWLLPGALLPLPAPAQELTDAERDVPFVPTPQAVVAEMLRLAQVTERDVVYDLGCGDGRIVITAARDMGARGVGIDIDPARIAESRANARQAGVADRVSFRQEDLFQVDIRPASVLTLYLLPEVNLRLRPKILSDLRPGTRVVSHNFDMEEWKADQVSRVGYRTVYFWLVPANARGTWEWQGTGGNPYRLDLEQRFQEVSGSVETGERRLEIIQPRLRGERLQFEIDDGAQGRVIFDGVVQGDAIKGTMRAPGKEAVDWRAVRVSATLTAGW